MSQVLERPKPEFHAERCKGCGRCIEACARGCIEAGQRLHPVSGLLPVEVDLEDCTGCNLCVEACPEPHGLSERASPAAPYVPAPDVPDAWVELPPTRPMLLKGNHAAAVGALLAGCRHFFGYPITPSTEGAELMAKLLPRVGGHFLQAPSEVAAANMMYGCGGAGLRCVTFTSSPGFSLMLEAISYMVGAEIPGVFVNVMRVGPGLGGIGPEGSDVKLACRGLGHGDTHAIVLAPSTPQEMLDLTMLAFDLAMAYRNPVVVLAEGYLGQMTGTVRLPSRMVRPGLPAWAVWGDAGHRRNLISSIQLDERDQEAHELHLFEKYAAMEREARAELHRCEDAEVLLVGANTPARIALGAAETLRAGGVRAGVFRPVTLWPFPIAQLRPLLRTVRQVVVVEASRGQLEDELRLALSHAGAPPLPIAHVRRHGGALPAVEDIVAAARDAHTAAREVA